MSDTNVGARHPECERCNCGAEFPYCDCAEDEGAADAREGWYTAMELIDLGRR